MHARGLPGVPYRSEREGAATTVSSGYAGAQVVDVGGADIIALGDKRAGIQSENGAGVSYLLADFDRRQFVIGGGRIRGPTHSAPRAPLFSRWTRRRPPQVVVRM